jgi:hypothetical protein
VHCACNQPHQLTLATLKVRYCMHVLYSGFDALHASALLLLSCRVPGARLQCANCRCQTQLMPGQHRLYAVYCLWYSTRHACMQSQNTCPEHSYTLPRPSTPIHSPYSVRGCWQALTRVAGLRPAYMATKCPSYSWGRPICYCRLVLLLLTLLVDVISAWATVPVLKLAASLPA